MTFLTGFKHCLMLPHISFGKLLGNISTDTEGDSSQKVFYHGCSLLFETPWTVAHQASLSITISLRLLKLMFIELAMPSNLLILCHCLLILPSTFPRTRVFSNELALCIRWPNYCSFTFRISPSNEYSGLVSFRIDWLDLLAVERMLKSLLQHHSSKASILQCSAFFTAKLSHQHMTSGLDVPLSLSSKAELTSLLHYTV